MEPGLKGTGPEESNSSSFQWEGWCQKVKSFQYSNFVLLHPICLVRNLMRLFSNLFVIFILFFSNAYDVHFKQFSPYIRAYMCGKFNKTLLPKQYLLPPGKPPWG